MSVLIPGMEMPKNCAECPLNHDAECAVKNCMVIDDCYVRRAYWCPVVPVPPHGDLIDRDDFFATCPELVDGYKRITDDLVIIPAEEGEG